MYQLSAALSRREWHARTGELDDKFWRLTRHALGEPAATALYERLQRLEDEENRDWLS